MKKILGDLYRRTHLNFERLKGEEYYAPKMHEYSAGWPGDFVGRATLALSSLFESLEGYDEERKEILEHLDTIRKTAAPNEHFYEGPLFDGKTVDEQQVSGNSWYIRGLIKYYKITKDETILAELKSIVENYILPLSPFYDTYPLIERERGEVSGNLTGDVINNWKVSTDIGCAFIMTDGITDLFDLLKDDRLKPMIEKMIQMFSTADFVGLCFQTHATLTFTRACFRYFESTKEKKYFDIAKRILDLYLEKGTTYDLSNINWFNRPDSWTEPCAIVDSLILLKKFYLLTKDTKYLVLFNKIYLNSIRTFERINGGAGCSTCATGTSYTLKSSIFEAFFCCTMRFGEGLSEISSFTSFDEGKSLVIPLNAKTRLEDEFNDILIDNELYDKERITVEAGKTNYKEIKLYVPVNSKVEGYEIKDSFITLPIEPNSTYIIKVEPLINEDGAVLRLGDMILTKKKKHTDIVYHYNQSLYSIINDNSKMSEEEMKTFEEYLK